MAGPIKSFSGADAKVNQAGNMLTISVNSFDGNQRWNEWNTNVQFENHEIRREKF